MKTIQKKRLVVITTILAFFVVVAASLAVAAGRDQSSRATISAKGAEVRLSPRTHRAARFHFDGALPDVFLLGIRGDRAFYRLVGQDGQTCFGVGSAHTLGKPGDIACWRRLSALMDYSTVEVVRGRSEPRLLRIEGFAADGITQVQAVDETGRLIGESPVTDNIYHLGVPAGLVKRLVARDSSGAVAGGLQFPGPAPQESR